MRLFNDCSDGVIYDQGRPSFFRNRQSRADSSRCDAATPPPSPPRTQARDAKKLINKSRDHFLLLFIPRCLATAVGSFLFEPILGTAISRSEIRGVPSHFLSLSTTLFCFHHFIMRALLNPPRSYPFLFYFLFTSFVSNVPHLLLPLLLPSRTYTHAHSFAFLPFLPTVENARYFHRRAPRGQSDRERNQPDARTQRRFVRRASRSRRCRESATPWNLAPRSADASEAIFSFPYDHPPPLTCYPDRARRVLLSPFFFFFFFKYLPLSLLSRKSRGFFQSRSRSVAARSSVGGLRMTSCDRSPRKRSGSLTLSPSCLARSLPRSRRLGSLFVAPPSSSPRPSLSLASARRRSRVVSFSPWRRAPAGGREKE